MAAANAKEDSMKMADGDDYLSSLYDSQVLSNTQWFHIPARLTPSKTLKLSKNEAQTCNTVHRLLTELLRLEQQKTLGS